MKFGLATTGRTDPSLLVKFVIRAEELGFDSFLVSDHFMQPTSNSTIDAWTLLPYLAAKTKRIRLGTCVTPVTFRPPAILAKMIASADLLSDGRIIFGAGAGWFKPEFDGYSHWLENKQRVAASVEALDLMTRLWSSESVVSFQGKFFHSDGAVLEPSPIQKPHPQIWMGGQSPYIVKLAGRYTDGWIPSGPRWYSGKHVKPQEYSQKVEVIKSELAKRNYETEKFVYSILINRASDSKTLIRDISDYAEAGMNYFILGESGADNESRLDDLEIVSKEIMPNF